MIQRLFQLLSVLVLTFQRLLAVHRLCLALEEILLNCCPRSDPWSCIGGGL